MEISTFSQPKQKDRHYRKRTEEVEVWKCYASVVCLCVSGKKRRRGSTRSYFELSGGNFCRVRVASHRITLSPSFVFATTNPKTVDTGSLCFTRRKTDDTDPPRSPVSAGSGVTRQHDPSRFPQRRPSQDRLSLGCLLLADRVQSPGTLRSG